MIALGNSMWVVIEAIDNALLVNGTRLVLSAAGAVRILVPLNIVRKTFILHQ